MNESNALILGGGGITGIAWEIGLMLGLLERGVDLTRAEVTVGTSAGSVVAAMVLGGRTLEQLYAEQLKVFDGERHVTLGRVMLLRYAWALWREKTPVGFGARIGHLALVTKTETEDERRPAFEALLGRAAAWPERPLQITAVNAATGEFRVFDKNSGVALIDAVGASAAVPGVWPPVSIGGARYIDGGMRSVTNAHLAQGRKRVVILAPLPFGAGALPSVRVESEALRAAGAQVAVVVPDQPARALMGKDALDPKRRAVAAQAGYAQAAQVREKVAAVWGSVASPPGLTGQSSMV